MPSIFISYASPDAAIANTVVSSLEAAGLRCWIAPRDVVPGSLYADEIVRAINESSLVVLVLSAHSAASVHVGKELERASSKGRRIIALRMDVAALPPAFEYFLSESQWIEIGAGGLDAATHKLTEAAQRHLGSATAATPLPGSGPNTLPPVPRPARKGIAAVAVAAALLLAGAGIFWAVNRSDGTVSVKANPGTSLAVLPFVDLSPEQDQGYFSDGLSEELLNQLAQFKDLRLTARTSSFSFKGKNEDVRVIGQKLGVAHVLEGSVRKSGDKLRITAQLIDTKDGTHLWSQTYDRSLTEVFAMQDEIAKAVTRTLSIALDVGDMSRALGGTTSIEAYDKYLRARELDRRRGGRDDFVQASQFYREAVQIDPGFIRAWADLYNELDSSLIYVPENAAATRVEMTGIVEHLQETAPKDWRTRVVRAAQFMEQRKWREADVELAAARESGADLNASTINIGYIFLLNTGRLAEALPLQKRRREADPLSLNASYAMQIILYLAGRNAEADTEYERSKGLEGNHLLADSFTLRRMMASPSPDVAAILARVRSFPSGVSGVSMCSPQVVTLEQKAGVEFVRNALENPAFQTATSMLELAGCADYLGERELALRALHKSYADMHGTNVGMLWQPWKSGLRAAPGFKQLLKDIGLAEYFRASGRWGDFCKPAGDSDFECL